MKLPQGQKLRAFLRSAKQGTLTRVPATPARSPTRPKKHQKTAKKAKKNAQGPRREGAGRPSLYAGKNLSKHATGYFTDDAWEKIHEIRDWLLTSDAAKRERLNTVSISDALEACVHTMYKEITRKAA